MLGITWSDTITEVMTNSLNRKYKNAMTTTITTATSFIYTAIKLGSTSKAASNNEMVNKILQSYHREKVTNNNQAFDNSLSCKSKQDDMYCTNCMLK